MLPVAVGILAVVFLLIIVRQVGRVRLPIWLIMTAGAAAALLTGSITPAAAAAAINGEVIVFLFGMFVLGVGMERSGLLHAVSLAAFSRAVTRKQVLFWFIFLMGGAAAFLMNDTVAIIGTPIALYCVKRYKIPASTMLVALAATVTFGSVITPIGNPQVLLIAMSGGIPDAFGTFFVYMLIPALVSMYLLYRLLLLKLPEPEMSVSESHDIPETVDPALARLVKVTFSLVIAMIVLRVGLSFVGYELPFAGIALAAALPLLLFSPRRVELFQNIDWSTLLFFASMFVLMAAVWETGVIQSVLPHAFTTSMPVLFGVSLLVPQLVSNVPYVALVLPIFEAAAAPVHMYIALAAGSTISGALTILGAASSVIVIQNAEKHGSTMTFWEYSKIGVPLTVVSAAVFIGWIWLVSLF